MAQACTRRRFGRRVIVHLFFADAVLSPKRTQCFKFLFLQMRREMDSFFEYLNKFVKNQLVFLCCK